MEYNALKQTRGGDRKSKEQNVPLKATAEQLADKHQVSHMTIKRDGHFAEAVDSIVASYGEPEVRRQLLSGDVRLTPKIARLLLQKPAEALKPAVDHLIAKGRLPRRKGSKDAADSRQVAEKLLSRLRTKGDEHARSVLQEMASLLGLVVSENVAEQ